MLRSVSLSAVHVRQIITFSEVGRWITCRIVQQTLPTVSQHARSFHLSTHKLSDDDSKRPTKGRTDSGNKPRSMKAESRKAASLAEFKKRAANVELRTAAIKAAKSLPGDWTRVAEDLISRLQLKQGPNVHSDSPQPKRNDESLLKTMEVGKSFPGRRRGGGIEDPSAHRAYYVADKDMYSGISVSEVRAGTTIRLASAARVARRVHNYTDLYQMERLGIFDSQKLKKEADGQVTGSESEDLWAKVDAENTRRALGGLPRNAFEEMIDLTKKGKLWKFPIDNEADMDEERKYSFQDHVFLEQHLSEFPDKGPVRKFMELIALGLSKNPYISVPEKIEHIRWFAEYFRKKQDILEASVGEQGRMKNSNQIE